MRNSICALAAFALCWSTAYASDTGHVIPRALAQPAQVAGSYTIDRVTGVMVPGQFHSRQAPIYDNTVNSTGFFGGAFTEGAEIGDDLLMVGGGVLEELDASIGNDPSSSGDLTACDVQFNFYDYDLVLIGTFTTHLDLSGSPLPPGFLVTYTLTNLGGENITLPAKVIMTQIVTNPEGGANVFDLGLYNPTVLGDSCESFYNTGGWFWFSGNPAGNFYGGIRVAAISGPQMIWSTGSFRSVSNAGTLFTTLGFTSGKLTSLGRNQRWSAIPFRVDADTTINTIDTYWFSTAGSEANDVNYIIWRRTGLAAPVNADIYAQGRAGAWAFGNGVVIGAEGLSHSYSVNIPIVAGNYYLTLYGNGGTTTDNVINWCTGGEKQDPNLEQAFMWRSENFPTPGFVQYDAGGVLQPGPDMLDANALWNPCFTLWGPGGAQVCRGDTNCDGSVNFNDINPFVLALSNFAGWQAAFPNCPTGNVDVNGDTQVDFNDINPFVTLLSGGGGPCQ